MTTEFERTHARLSVASTPEDVFGKFADGIDRIQAVGRLYKQLVHIVHPDHNPSEPKRSAEAMQKLTHLRLEAEERIRAGLYWTKTPTPKVTPIDTAPRWIDVRGKRYAIGGRATAGDICHVYLGTDGKSSRVFKLAQHPSDNDLVEHEAKVLKEIEARCLAKNLERGPYQCTLVDSFLLRSKTQSRRVNVLEDAEGHWTLAKVAQVYRNGLDYRDIAWMFKRTLAALWYLHRTGFIHGAVLPEHVLVHPITHGAKLIDFCYAAETGRKVRALSGPRRANYAPEILAKQPVGPWTDIFMAAKAFRPMLAADTPSRITGFFDGCMLVPVGHRRSLNAGDLHDEFDQLLRKHAGPPAYRRLAMPPEGGAT
jgi:hypothetical protein